MSTNTFSAAANAWHQRYLQDLDSRAAQEPGSDTPAQRRLSRAHVCLVADAGMMAPMLRAWRHLGLGRLSVVPLDSAAQAVLQQELPCLGDSVRASAQRVLDPRNFTLGLYGVDMVAVALTRPHPRQLATLNAIAVRHGVALCPAVLDGARLELGPLVLPGVSACLACADVRRTANATHVEAAEAERQFYDRNPAFEAPGRFESLARVAASLLGMEIKAMIGGTHLPHAINSLVTYDLAITPKSHRFIPYYEWCDVCRPCAGQHERSAGFAAFLERRAMTTTGSIHE
jgi:bacteriocin biosynthesis cyclodehydratase domain-containing protein